MAKQKEKAKAAADRARQQSGQLIMETAIDTTIQW
jgi:hypothetical protein